MMVNGLGSSAGGYGEHEGFTRAAAKTKTKQNNNNNNNNRPVQGR